MNFKNLVWVSFISLAIGGCRSEQTVVDKVNDLVERCWEFVDTGKFPSRGLYWVSGTSPIRTYDDRTANLRIQYAGKSPEDLFCAISNQEVAWSQTDRNAVFDAIDKAAPEWVASRNDAPVEDVRRSNIADGAYQRHLEFQSSSAGRVFIAIHEEVDTGIVTVLTGRGIFFE